MKKLFSLVLVFIICFAVFASNDLSIYIYPYTFQAVTKSDNDEIKSTNGIGGGLSYEKSENGVGKILGVDLSANTNFYKDKPNLSDFELMAKLGYGKRPEGKKYTLQGFLKYGLGLQVYDKTYSLVQFCGLAGKINFNTEGVIPFYIGVEGLIATPHKAGISYANYKFNTVFGIKQNF